MGHFDRPCAVLRSIDSRLSDNISHLVTTLGESW